MSSDETVATVTVTVSSSMVTITPISIGTAIITVTADDGNDGTVGQTFNAVVQAAQAPPTAKDTITTQNLTVGTIGTLDVSPYFDDVNNDPLTYSALSSDDAIATVAINTNTATISPISDGTATITVTADDGNSGTGGGTVDQTFQVVVANQPPTADAGPDQNVGEGDTVMLDGSGSSDPAGKTLTYEWTQTAGTTVQLNNPTSIRPTFTAPAVNETLTFSLRVTDSQSQNSADTVDITVAAVPACTTVTVQQSKAVPSAAFVLTFAFAGNCRPAGFTDATFTVLLHEDIGVPTGFGKDDIYVNSARGSFVPNYVFKRSDDDGDEEIEIAGCGQWRPIGASPNSASTKCADVGSLRSIQLRGLTLPSRPADAAEETYDVSIQWGSNQPFTRTIDVGATLEIDGDKLGRVDIPL